MICFCSLKYIIIIESYCVFCNQIVMGGKNKYLVNGLNVQNKRVTDMFCSVQLNVNNPHFLIMQGRITKVLNMKPPEVGTLILSLDLFKYIYLLVYLFLVHGRLTTNKNNYNCACCSFILLKSIMYSSHTQIVQFVLKIIPNFIVDVCRSWLWWRRQLVHECMRLKNKLQRRPLRGKMPNSGNLMRYVLFFRGGSAFVSD